jgi:hypothetical protein
MSLYADSDYPVRDEITAAHTEQIARLGEAGTWGTGAQRRAVAVETRKACYDAGILEPSASEDLETDVDLPEGVRDAIRVLAADCKEFDQSHYQLARDAGLSDEEYTEVMAIVSFVADLDVFARGIGVDPRPIPAAQPGNPTRERPVEAVPEQAFVPTVPVGEAGGASAEAMYHGKPFPYIMRALSLVPAEFAAHLSLEGAQYMPLPKVLEPDFQNHEGLIRPQVEVIAGRVSALNDCFY